MIRDLAEGRAVDYNGHHRPVPVGADGRLEMWMAAYGPKALDLVGREADGFILQLADPYITAWTVRDGAGGRRPTPGATPTRSPSCVAAPAYVGDDLAHAARPVPLVRRHGRQPRRRPRRPGTASTRAAVPAALTEYIKARQGYDYSHHGRAGNPSTDFVPDEVVDRFCILGPVEDHVDQARGAARPRRRPVRGLPHARRPGGDARRLRQQGDPRPFVTIITAPETPPVLSSKDRNRVAGGPRAPRQPRPAGGSAGGAGRRAGRRAGRDVGAVQGRLEGVGWTWPVRPDDTSMPHVWSIVDALFEPARRGGEDLYGVILIRAAPGHLPRGGRRVHARDRPRPRVGAAVPLVGHPAARPHAVRGREPDHPAHRHRPDGGHLGQGQRLAGLVRRGGHQRLPHVLPGHRQHASRADLAVGHVARADAVVRGHRRAGADEAAASRRRCRTCSPR